MAGTSTEASSTQPAANGMLYITVIVKLLNEFCINTATATTATVQFLEDVCNSVLVDNDFCALKDSEKDIVKGI